MKRAILVFLQLVVFLVVFFVGSLLPSIPSTGVPLWSIALGSTHIFVLDGLLFATVLFVLVLVIEAAMKRIATAGKATTLAFALAVVLGLLMKFGFKSLS